MKGAESGAVSHEAGERRLEPWASGVGVVPALQAVRAAVISLPAGPGGPVRRAPV